MLADTSEENPDAIPSWPDDIYKVLKERDIRQKALAIWRVPGLPGSVACCYCKVAVWVTASIL